MKKIGLIFIILFSLLIINGVEYECYESEKYYRDMEKFLIENYDFVQNGVKLEYITNTSIIEEKNRIIEILTNELISDIDIFNNRIVCIDEMLTYNINLINGEKTKIEIVIMNTSSNFNSSDLRQAVENLKNSKCIDERIYYFSKVRIDEEKNILPFILDGINEDTIEEAEISNGKVLKAEFIDGSKINMGQINYDTGKYIIIGTPIIFVTY